MWEIVWETAEKHLDKSLSNHVEILEVLILRFGHWWFEWNGFWDLKKKMYQKKKKNDKIEINIKQRTSSILFVVVL